VDDANDVANGRATDITFGPPGKAGTAARSNGTSSIIRIPNEPSMNPGTGDFSVSVSVRFSVLPGASTFDVVRKGVDGDGGHWKVELFNQSAPLGRGASDGTTPATRRRSSRARTSRTTRGTRSPAPSGGSRPG
jgi:hypothetical protein